MKKWCILLSLCLAAGGQLVAQDVVFRSLKDFLAGKGDTITTLKVERRSKSQVMMTGGADYKLSVDETELKPKFLRNRCGIVQVDDKLFINCRKLRYKKLQFGNWYAPAFVVRDMIYFVAIPLGQVAAGPENMDVKLGGPVGDAIAASSLVGKRVCYSIDPLTGVVDFVGVEKMEVMLKNNPDWLKDYLKEENNEAAEVTTKYLLKLKNIPK